MVYSYLCIIIYARNHIPLVINTKKSFSNFHLFHSSIVRQKYNKILNVKCPPWEPWSYSSLRQNSHWLQWEIYLSTTQRHYKNKYMAYKQYLCFVVSPFLFSEKHRVNATSVMLLCLTPSLLLYE